MKDRDPRCIVADRSFLEVEYEKGRGISVHKVFAIKFKVENSILLMPGLT